MVPHVIDDCKHCMGYIMGRKPKGSRVAVLKKMRWNPDILDAIDVAVAAGRAPSRQAAVETAAEEWLERVGITFSTRLS